MFGPPNASELLRDLPQCAGNCPRVYPPITEDDLRRLEEESARWSQDAQRRRAREKRSLLEEYTTKLGQLMLPLMEEPCYLLFRINRKDCRAMRNYFIGNSSRLEVIRGSYCGIAPLVYNVKNGAVEDRLGFGLLRFRTTDQAYRFVINESKMDSDRFLPQDWDVWNLSLCAEDRSTAPSIRYADKVVNKDNVFILLHIQRIAKLADERWQASDADRQCTRQWAAEHRRSLEQHIDSVTQHSGRIVVKTDTAQRLRGWPQKVDTQRVTESVPQKFVYVVQWPGVRQFWTWYECEAGRQFISELKAYTEGNYQLLLFTACLDFHNVT